MFGVKEFAQIKNNFIKESNILEMDPDTKYKMEIKEEDYSILSYEDNGKNTIKVPNALIPFWSKNGDNLYYKDGEFNRDL